MKAPQILRLRDIKQLTRLSKASIYRLMHAGVFPRSVKLGPRAVGWFADEVAEWLDARPRARLGNQPNHELSQSRPGSQRTRRRHPPVGASSNGRARSG